MWQPGWEESLREEWIHVYIWLSPFTVHLKSSDTVNQLYPIQKIFSKVGGWGRAGLGILEFLEVWSTLWGLMKSYDSQETNSIVKNSSKTRAAFLHTQICGNPWNCNVKSHRWSGCTAWDLFLIGTSACYYRGASQHCLNLDIDQPNLVMHVRLLFSIVSISFL